jgi:peptidoglycan/LPS O-acetylase OafA/YrhL
VQIPPIPRPCLDGLQALRAAAALLVVADHALCTYTSKVAPGGDNRFAWLVGDTGVWMFFVISGLTMILAHGADFGAPGAPLAFARRRVARIVPLYWLVTLLTFLELRLKHEPVALAGLGLSFLFVPYQPGNDVYGRPIYASGWTLEYEMFFYALFCLSLLWPRRTGLAVLVTCFVALAGASLSRLVAPHSVIGYLSQPIVLLFVAGMLLGQLRLALDGAKRPRWGFTGAVSVAAAAVGAALTWAATTDATAVPVHAACVAAALLGVGAAALAIEAPVPSLPGRLARAVGDATFSIYMTHEFVLGPCGRMAARAWPTMPRAAFVAFTLVLAAMLGLAVFTCVERPLIRSARRVLESPTSARAPVIRLRTSGTSWS